ncbi:MAG: cytochrome c biogenesis protein CcdA, partial [Bifidobacteriaceae bacterium]|nr:cytochrome c biogenesis protein CcdA [Bifidobacteriaceae bacterium]
MIGGVSAGAAVLAGVIAFASPCFLPLVPVWVGYMTGLGEAPGQASQGGPLALATRSRQLRAATHAALFVTAFSAVFMALWGLVALVGWVVADYRVWLRVIGGGLLMLMGLNRAGWISLAAFSRQGGPSYRPDLAEAPTWRRSILLGLAFGAGWTPCIGPVLGAVLGLAT